MVINVLDIDDEFDFCEKVFYGGFCRGFERYFVYGGKGV